MEVSNSKFLGPIALDFNPQFNAVIGGRGTGKSTILEYIRWALCDQPPSSQDTGEEVADFQRRRQTLIEGTLLPLDAVVDISFLLNGVSHIVRRKASGELTLKIGDAPFQACTEQNIRELLPVRAYSQKQLSAVGARLDELRRFVHAPIQGDLEALQERIAGLGIDLRAGFDRVIRYRTLRAEIAAHDIERRSLNEQIAKLRVSLKGLSPDDRAIIARQGVYETEQRVVQSLDRDMNAARQKTTPNPHKISHDASGRVETEGRTSRQNEGVNLFDRHLGLEQRRVAHRRRAPGYRNRRCGGLIEDDGRDAGSGAIVVRRSDAHSGDVRDQICRHNDPLSDASRRRSVKALVQADYRNRHATVNDCARVCVAQGRTGK